MVNFENMGERHRNRWKRRMDRYNRYGHVWTGAFIMLIGVAALVKATVTDLPYWVFSWPMFLIVFGLFLGVKHGFRGLGWVIMLVVGGIFLTNEIDPGFAHKGFAWPIAAIVIGLFIILRPGHRRGWQQDKMSEKKTTGSDITDATVIEDSYDISEDFVDTTSIFGGSKKNIISKNFKGGDITNIFGGTDLDLTRADFNGTAMIDLTTIFGGTKLIVPSDWTVKYEAVAIFAGLEDKREVQTAGSNPNKVLVLKGTVIFGGTEIKSF